MSLLSKTIVGTAIVAACLLGSAGQSQAATHIVVLNATSGNITVSCDNTGQISPGQGPWSCLNASIITQSGQRYSVTDTGGHGDGGSCGGAWDIR